MDLPASNRPAPTSHCLDSPKSEPPSAGPSSLGQRPAPASIPPCPSKDARQPTLPDRLVRPVTIARRPDLARLALLSTLSERRGPPPLREGILPARREGEKSRGDAGPYVLVHAACASASNHVRVLSGQGIITTMHHQCHRRVHGSAPMSSAMSPFTPAPSSSSFSASFSASVLP